MTREFPGLHDPAAPVWRSARGEYVEAADGRRYVDLSMGFGACLFGHGAAEQVIREANPAGADALPHGLGDLQTSELREHALERLCSWAEGNWPAADAGDLRAVVFQTGSDAVDTAVKTALLATGRERIVSFTGSYHGTFGMALSVTHRPRCREPFLTHLGTPGSVRFEPYGEVPQLDGRDACVVVEPIQGRGGLVVPPAGFLRELRAACTAAGTLLVVDSILVGCGRTGVPLAGAECNPDLLCLGKALGSGVPASAVLAKSAIAERAWARFSDEAIHTSTFVGHPFSCAAIVATLGWLDETDLAAACAPIESTVRAAAAATGLAVRGAGALWALDTDTPGGGVALSRALQEEGFIVPPSGPHGESVTLTPALTTRQASLVGWADALIRRVPQLPTQRDGSVE